MGLFAGTEVLNEEPDDVARGRRVQVSGRFSFTEAGAGRVAILVPGLGLTARFYAQSLAAFAQSGIRLIIPDLPGYGATPGRATGEHPVTTAGALAALCDEIGIDSAVWIGHSLGAQVVAELAAIRPDLARGIALVGPTGARGKLPLLRQMWGLTVEAKRAGARTLAAVFRDYMHASPIRYFGTWLKYSEDQLLDVLPRIHCPALLLAGDDDPLCPAAHIEQIRQRLGDARVTIIAGATHALPHGSPDAFNREVIRFVLSV
jgi:2-hydroxy-6-oxonona-2,4-dienedioate hydrolase